MTPQEPLTVSVTLALDRFELNVEFAATAQVTGVFGPSGSGKTSLLETLAGLRRGAKGTIRLGREVWLDTAARVNLPPERRHVGYVPQEGLLFPHQDVHQNLQAGAARGRRDGRPFGELMKSVCTVLELAPLLDRDVVTISGGERQRVALGRAICSGPRLMLLDEPLASLDLPLRRKVLPFLRRVRSEFRIPMILVSHDPTEVQALCDDLIVLGDGTVIARGSPRDVLTDPRVFPSAEERGFENVLTCTLVGHDGETSEVRLDDAGTLRLVTPRAGGSPGDSTVVGVPAREIMVATHEPTGLSARNILPARIARIEEIGHARLVKVALADGIPDLAVEVTARACQDLELRPGLPVFLIIKTAGCVIYGSGAADSAKAP